jgi:hypothetical protein
VGGGISSSKGSGSGGRSCGISAAARRPGRGVDPAFGLGDAGKGGGEGGIALALAFVSLSQDLLLSFESGIEVNGGVARGQPGTSGEYSECEQGDCSDTEKRRRKAPRQSGKR